MKNWIKGIGLMLFIVFRAVFKRNNLKKVIFDSREMWKYQCRRCRQWGYLDDGQFTGKVSIQCGCGFRNTIDFRELQKKYSDMEGGRKFPLK